MLVNGERAEALIIESVKIKKSTGVGGRKQRRGSSATTQFAITVSYKDSQGIMRTAMPPVNDNIERRKGETVNILYRAKEPEQVLLDTWTSKYAPTLIPLIIGLIFVVLGVALSRPNFEEDDVEV